MLERERERRQVDEPWKEPSSLLRRGESGIDARGWDEQDRGNDVVKVHSGRRFNE
jgi:hypothetical protein